MNKTAIDSDIREFMEHVCSGLSRQPKKLSSKYFYDDEGSRIFQQIMRLPEYYLTAAEDEILRLHSPAIFQAINYRKPFNIVELGAGDGAKTLHLLKAFSQQNVPFDFVPIDISQQAIDDLVDNVHRELPQLSIKPVVGDYFEVLDDLVSADRPNLVLFLGSNIGNFEVDAAKQMFKRLRERLNKGDHLLVGFDLRKDPNLIRAAYFDSTGVTKSFNLNLLLRINRELGGDFYLENFDFYSFYDPVAGEVRSFIVSISDQVVSLDHYGASFPFKKGEVIHTELSKKYHRTEIDELAVATGFLTKQHFQDANQYFTDALWCRQK